MDGSHREKMIEWCYQMAEFCKFDGETVAIAISYLDRFVGNTEIGSHALYDLSIFQCAAMTALYTAVKINEPAVINAKIVSNLSQGTYTEEQIERMEFNMLQALEWRVNPPTAIAFVRQFLEILPSNILCDQGTRDTIYEISKYQIELALRNSRFLGVKNSIIALASFMNALESIRYLDRRAVEFIERNIPHVLNVDLCSKKFMDAQIVLYNNVGANCYNNNNNMGYINNTHLQNNNKINEFNNTCDQQPLIFPENSPRSLLA